MRLESQSRVIWEQFPAEYHDLVLVLTDLGDVTVVILLLSILYWVVDRRRAALIASYAAAGVAVLLILKLTFALPRPGAELVAREYDPHGFPSGHAFTAVVVYGGLTYAFEKHRDPSAVVAVGTLILGISLSRVVLAFHYLGDVIAGAGLGVAFVAVMERLSRGDPRRGFAIGAVLAVPAIAVTSGEATVLAMVGLGASVGGLIGTTRLGHLPTLRSRREAIVLVVVGLGFVVAVTVLESALLGDELVAIAAVHVALFSGIFLAPEVVGRIEHPLVAGRSPT